MSRFTMHVIALRFAAIVSAAAFVASCQSTGERLMAQAARRDTCGAKPLRPFIGVEADQKARNAIEQRVTNRRQLRWIAPEQDILADLNTGRVNIAIDRSGRIGSIGCY